MTDRDTERGELRKDQPDPRGGREPHEDARPNPMPSTDDKGRDAGRPGSESGGGD